MRRALERMAREQKERKGFEERKPRVFKDDDVYTIVSAGRNEHTVKISENALRQLKKYYCLEKLTINQLCREMRIPRRDFYLIKTAFGITKDDAPYIDEDLINQPDDALVTDSLQEKKRLYFIKLQQKEIEQLRKENNEYRKQDYWLEKIAKLADEHITTFSKTYKGPNIIVPKCPAEQFMIEPNLLDLHLGKLGWAPETGENYDYKISRNRYFTVIDDIYNRMKNLKVERILFPIGSDFFQIDNNRGETTAGTSVDNDSRSQKLFLVGLDMVIESIDKFSTIAPVTVVEIPGNHDEQTSFFLMVALSKYYEKNDRVQVWTNLRVRKYVEFGINLIGFAHGHNEGKRILGNMQVEVPEAWGRTKIREWHVGHKHRYSETEENGVRVRELSALTGKDYWEFKKGYVGALTRSQTFVWNREKGLYGTWESIIWANNNPEKAVLTL